VQLFSLAFIAEYIGKIFEEVKRRPHYIVSRVLNFGPEASPAHGKGDLGEQESGSRSAADQSAASQL
jgi:hypothetical protein